MRVLTLIPPPRPGRRLTGCLIALLCLGLGSCVNYRDIDSDQQMLSVTELQHSRSLTTDTEGSWPGEHWWQVFADPGIDRLVEEALANNPTLTDVDARVRLASAALQRAQSDLLPNLLFNGAIKGQHYSENGLVPTDIGGKFKRSGELTLRAQYQLDFWGRNRATVAASRSRQAAFKAEAASARLLLANAVTKTYFELAQWQRIDTIARLALQQREKIVDLTRQRVDAGLDNAVQLQQALTQLPLTRMALAQIHANIITTQHSLAALLGAGPDRLLDLHARLGEDLDPHLALPANLPAGLLDQRPDLVAARWQVEATLSDIAARKAEFYPDINLMAFAGYSSIGLGSLLSSGSAEFGLQPAVSLPLFDGNRLRAELRADYASYESAVANFNQTLLLALRDVADQITTYRALQPQLQEVQLALQSARAARDLALRRYQSGLGNYLTVLNTETTVTTQEIQRSLLQQQALSARAELARALGGGFPGRHAKPITPSSTSQLAKLQATTGEIHD